MLTRGAVAWFGSVKALSAALGLTSQAVSGWGAYVPDLRQLQIDDYTGGEVPADPHLVCQREPDFDD